MQPTPVVEDLDEFEEDSTSHVPGGQHEAVNDLLLEGDKEAVGHGLHDRCPGAPFKQDGRLCSDLVLLVSRLNEHRDRDHLECDNDAECHRCGRQ